MSCQLDKSPLSSSQQSWAVEKPSSERERERGGLPFGEAKKITSPGFPLLALAAPSSARKKDKSRVPSVGPGGAQKRSRKKTSPGSPRFALTELEKRQVQGALGWPRRRSRRCGAELFFLPLLEIFTSPDLSSGHSDCFRGKFGQLWGTFCQQVRFWVRLSQVNLACGRTIFWRFSASFMADACWGT